MLAGSHWAGATGERQSIPLEVDAVLLRLGLGTLAGDTVQTCHGRNENWAGTTSAGIDVFVKRVIGHAHHRSALRRATEFERFADGASLPDLLRPRCLGWHEQSNVQVFEWLRDAKSGADLAKEEAFDKDLAHQVGRAIGALHEAEPTAALDQTPPPSPPINMLSALSLTEFMAASNAELEVWHLLQNDEALRNALVRLRQREAATEGRPIHGDFRLDQLIVSKGAVYFIDWEEFRLGDPARDVGSFAGEWLFRAVTGISTITGQHDGDSMMAELADEMIIERGQRELARLRPMVRAFWAGYRETRLVLDPSFTERAAAFAGWHMFDRLLSAAHWRPRTAPIHRAAAGIGRNLVFTPGRFISVLGLGDNA